LGYAVTKKKKEKKKQGSIEEGRRQVICRSVPGVKVKAVIYSLPATTQRNAGDRENR